LTTKKIIITVNIAKSAKHRSYTKLQIL